MKIKNVSKQTKSIFYCHKAANGAWNNLLATQFSGFGKSFKVSRAFATQYRELNSSQYLYLYLYLYRLHRFVSLLLVVLMAAGTGANLADSWAGGKVATWRGKTEINKIMQAV